MVLEYKSLEKHNLPVWGTYGVKGPAASANSQCRKIQTSRKYQQKKYVPVSENNDSVLV